MTDDFDLTDDWEAEPDPPTDYGQAGPDIILEETAGIVWLWSSSVLEENIQYDGDPVDIED